MEVKTASQVDSLQSEILPVLEYRNLDRSQTS